jgi:hypothetical protein
MFLQVFADGTVIDSEGVHHIRGAELRPIVDAIQSGELYRVRGHCGAPPTDFIEYVHVVIYERRLGRLTAHWFSYSGNTQGCDQSIRQLHTTLENLQAKLSRQPTNLNPQGGVGNSTAPLPLGPSANAVPEGSVPYHGDSVPGVAPRADGQPSVPGVNPSTGDSSGSVIPLTPVE